jgi:hypothetical protein
VPRTAFVVTDHRGERNMSGPIREFGLGLTDDWHALPAGDPPQGWADALAARIVEGEHVPDGVPAALARQLSGVKASVDATGVRGSHTAVFVENPAEPFIGAMLTVVLGRGVARETFESQLEQVVEGVDTAQVMGKQVIEAAVPAGSVYGAHFLIGHLNPDDGAAGAHLEERVHLGVFPSGSSDMIDVTAIAASFGAFQDMPVWAVGLLESLEVTTEGTA